MSPVILGLQLCLTVAAFAQVQEPKPSWEPVPVTATVPLRACLHPPAVTGPCKARLNRYTFSAKTSRCHAFDYGGCSPGLNHFVSKKECDEKCDKFKNDICAMTPKQTGRCRARFENYSYNETSMRCEKFIYGGCGGNKNNFINELDCTMSCYNACDQVAGDVGFGFAYMARFTYNQTTKRCEPFVYGGAFGTTNRFHSEKECQNTCYKPCDQPARNPGMGFAGETRYTYDRRTQRCETFIYGGILGNANNFRTQQDCHDKCANPCKDPPKDGEATVGKPRYSYVWQNNTCEQFTYGGKPGSKNNFKNQQDCRTLCYNPCLDQAVSVDTTCGKAASNLYTYVDYLDQCVSVPNSGCSVSGNRFKTRHECERKCVSPCKFPPKVNDNCPFTEERYSFNVTSYLCEKFDGCVYGNKNNFRTWADCAQVCTPVTR